jgi:hypothetical protein
MAKHGSLELRAIAAWINCALLAWARVHVLEPSRDVCAAAESRQRSAGMEPSALTATAEMAENQPSSLGGLER